MNLLTWLDKYRFLIGIILITIIGVGLIFLFFPNIFIKNINKDDYIFNLETKINELNARISQLESNGQIAGVTNQSENLNEQEKEENTQIAKTNINTAEISELEKIPGIGPTRAQYIIDYRKSHDGFKTTSEIQNIKGIGPATYDKLKDMITVE